MCAFFQDQLNPDDNCDELCRPRRNGGEGGTGGTGGTPSRVEDGEDPDVGEDVGEEDDEEDGEAAAVDEEETAVVTTTKTTASTAEPEAPVTTTTTQAPTTPVPAPATTTNATAATTAAAAPTAAATTTPEPTTTTRFRCDLNNPDADCECPKNCIACQSFKGAVAGDRLQCTECLPFATGGFVLGAGACLTKVSCKASKIVVPPKFGGEKCRCNDRNCNYCDQSSEGEVCKICRNGFYLHGDKCVAECPANLASMGSGEFKRRCAEPFECVKGNLFEFDTGSSRGVPYACKCATADNRFEPSCTNCNFNAGSFGQQCTRCNSKKLLHNGQCRDSCVGTGLAAYRPVVAS